VGQSLSGSRLMQENNKLEGNDLIFKDKFVILDVRAAIRVSYLE